MESLEILGKLTRNIAVNPADPKFRKLRLSNAKLKEAVVDTPGALSSLMAMGWQQDDAETESLIFPAGRQLTMAQVRLVEEAKDRLRKSQKEAARSKASSKVPTTSYQEAVRARMEADRLERLSRGPVMEGSKAQALPTSNAGITTARDIGIGDDRGEQG